ncbi:MAG: chaperonin GroEL [Anaerolineae bacterium]
MEKSLRRVVFQPATYQGLQRGINQMVDAVEPTLGPCPRVVAIDSITPGDPPELLDNGGLIVRRILELPNRDADMGAMFVRHVLWRVFKQVGDGTATAAVIFRTIFNEGVRYVTSGGDAMRFRRYLGEGLRLILDQLSSMTIPVQGKDALAQVAESVCTDPPLAKVLGEIFDIIGEYGQLEILEGKGRGIERRYVEGMYWEAGIFSREMFTDQVRLRVELQEVPILISNLSLKKTSDLVPVLDLVRGAGHRAFLIIAKELSEECISLLLSASQNTERFQVIAVRTPGHSSLAWAEAMEDIGILTGGRTIIHEAGDTLRGVNLNDLGHARRVWAERQFFGIVGGKGDPKRLRHHITCLRSAFGRRIEGEEAHKQLRERIGKLMGGSATLLVGGATESEVHARRELAERTANVLRAALRGGVLPGGGVALLNCRQGLYRQMKASMDTDERAAYRTLIKASETPIRIILTNAGFDASEVMDHINQTDSSHGLDVRSGKIVNVVQAGIWDVATVLKTAVQSAVAGASLALTTDVLVHHRNPEQVVHP